MSRKGENIYKRKDGRWEGRYIKSRSENGKARYGYVYAKSYRETKNKLSEAVHSSKDLSCKQSYVDNPIIFSKVASEWYEIRKPQIKESTSVKYYNLLNSYILPKLGNKTMNSLTHDYIESYCNELLFTGGKKGTGLSPKTVSDILSIIRNILNYCADQGHLLVCDARSITVKQTAKEMRILSRNEQKCICQYLFSNLTAYNIGILICLFTGIRIGEICALQWEDISLNERTIHVHQTMQRIQTPDSHDHKTAVIVTSPKSSCSIRTIPLPDELVEIISNFSTSTSGYFLTGSKVKYIEPRTMQNHFKQVLRECSIEETNYHTLRHTFATRCVELGFDTKSLSEILGHASVTITMNRYVHPSIELKRNNMERLSVLFSVR